MKPHRIREVLFTERQIRRRVRQMAAQLSRRQPVDPIVMVGILRGSFVFLADLVRELHRLGRRTVIDFLTLQSYGDRSASSGRVRLAQGISIEVRGRPVWILDDIFDTGHTLRYARTYLHRRGASEVGICVLLEKPARHAVPCRVDLVGFTVPDVFVVGYGLDYAGQYRELPCIAALEFLEGPAGGAG